MKISKIIAAGIVAATMAATCAVAASAAPWDTNDTPAETTAAVVDTAPAETTAGGSPWDTPAETTAANTVPGAGNVNAPTNNSKGSPETGVFDIFPLGGAALVSAGIIFAAKKRKK